MIECVLYEFEYDSNGNKKLISKARAMCDGFHRPAARDFGQVSKLTNNCGVERRHSV
jgi:hypothetical protein